MRRDNGEWFAVDDQGSLRVPLFHTAADAMLASDVGAGEAEVVAQEIRQQQPRLDLALALLAVDGDPNLNRIGHAAFPARSAAKATARRARTCASR